MILHMSIEDNWHLWHMFAARRSESVLDPTHRCSSSGSIRKVCLLYVAMAAQPMPPVQQKTEWENVLCSTSLICWSHALLTLCHDVYSKLALMMSTWRGHMGKDLYVKNAYSNLPPQQPSTATAPSLALSNCHIETDFRHLFSSGRLQEHFWRSFCGGKNCWKHSKPVGGALKLLL